jgi:outer membrane protein assembly factor BamB
VVGNAIYVAGRSLKRLSTAAGGVRWTFTLPAGRTIGMTPAYDRGIVVAVDNDDTGAVAGITAVSAASGTVLWRRTVVGGSAPASPSIAADRVYFPLYLDGIGVEMLALSLRTGATLWSWVPDVRQGLPSSPATDGHTVVLAMDGGLSAAGLDAVTGHELWRSAWGYNAPFHGTDGYAMALMGGRAYLSDHFGNLRALDARTGTQAWSVTLPTFTAWGVQATPGALLVNGVQSLVAVSPANGIILWTATGTSFTGGQGPASTAAGVVYSLQGYAYNSTVLLARRLSDGTVLAQFTLPRPVYQSTVAISRDRIYVQDAGRVIAYAPAS